MNQQHCAEVLSSAKFSGLDVVLRDSHDPALQNFSIVATTAVEDNDVLDSHKIEMPNGSRLFLIHHDDDTEQESIARQIQALIGDSQNTDFFDIQVASVTSAVDLSPFSQDTMIVFLLELGAPVWYTMDEKLYNKLQKLLVSNINSKMLWVGQNGSAGGGDGPELNQSAYRLIDGLSRALNSENDGEILSLLSLQQEGSLSARQMSHILAIIQKVHAQSDEYPDTEWVEKDGRLCVPRMVQSPSLKDKVSSRLIPQRQVQQAWNEGNGLDERVPLKLAFGTPGLLNTLHFVEDKEYSTSQLGEDELEIEVRAVGVNYRDVLSALGRLKNAQVGCECAGILTQVGSGVVSYQVGDRVAAISPIDCYRTYLRVDHRFTARIPDSMPLNIAAAMIINHLTAWWTLHELAHLAPDETVLVHSGAGGTGQAAVQVAQHIGAQVLATVGTEEKKALLKEQYGIDSDHIFSSRVASAFSRGVQRTTKDQGVDVILSALSGEGFISSWECLAPFGRFMEIGKRNIHERKSLPMARFDTGVSFHAFDIGVVCKSRPNTVRPMLEQLFDLHEKGVLRPAFPLQVHGVSDLEKVLRVMQRGDNMGKIVIEMRPEDKVKAVLDRKPTTSLRSDAAYMVAGGLGGLGRSMAAWLVDRGARHLILLARSGPRTQEARDFVESLTLRGVQVATPPCNISDADALRSVLDNCSSTMPPIRGAIQATGLLRDAIFERMSYETWQAAAAPKTLGSWNMHSLLPADMDFFIGISSVAGVAGGRGQANYAAANTYIDALMKYRVDQGLHGVALDLGVFLDIGFATENADLWARWEAQRALTVTEADLFALLDCCCSERIPTQVVYGINSFVQDPSIRHQFFRKAMLRTLALEDEEESGNSGGAGKQIAQDVDFGSVFAQTITLDDAASAVNEALLRKLSTMLALPRDQLDPDTPLHTYGVDSLVAVELRNWFAKEVHAELAIFDILGGATTRSASTLAAVKSRLKKGSWEETKV
jgi:NADPH:quinone reductase-like Zn-dependent oxidoreductase/NADP-dependent 3-hydroxy acid dehydrogenase YdfG/aryl carrier-like protein